MTSKFYYAFEEHIDVAKKTASQEEANVVAAAGLCTDAILDGKKMLIDSET